MPPTSHHARRSTDPPPELEAEDSGEMRVVARRVRSIDHNTRGSADAIYSAADLIRKVSEDFSKERRITAGYRAQYETMYGEHGSVPRQVEENRKAIEKIISRIAWATGALAALGTVITIVLRIMH